MNTSPPVFTAPLYATPEYQIGDPAPDPNHGDSANSHHWRRVDEIVSALRRAGYRDIRVDQQHVIGDRVAGYNRPDIQAIDRQGNRVNIEVDTDRNNRREHIREINTIDPGARSVFVRIHPRTGAVISRVIHYPDTPRLDVRTGNFTLDDLRRPPPPRFRPVPARRPAQQRVITPLAAARLAGQQRAAAARSLARWVAMQQAAIRRVRLAQRAARARRPARPPAPRRASWLARPGAPVRRPAVGLR